MKPRSVLVTAPSRLHFGMFSFGHSEQRQFGGVGVMVDKPGLQLRASESHQFEVVGPMSERVQIFARRYFNHYRIADPPSIRLEILKSPPEHVGLGVGTQLALSVISVLHVLQQKPSLTASQLAIISERAERSAVGTYGFIHGGMLIESGKNGSDELSPLIAQLPLPPKWRFVLVIPIAEQGKHGLDERKAFCDLPPVPQRTTERLQQIAYEQLVPAADLDDFEAFSEALHHYSRTAGLCYDAVQHGAFSTARLDQLVRRINELGIRGVGQTSWGPTIFALTADETDANKLVQSLKEVPEAKGSQMVITAPNIDGAKVEME